MARRVQPQRRDHRDRWERSRGQALVELVLVLPLFLALLFGVIDIGRIIWANDTVANAAREGSRFASIHAGTPSLTVPATKEEIRAHTHGFVVAGGVGTTVAVCFSAVGIASQQSGCTGDVDEPGAGYARGNLVTVTVVSRVPTLTGALLGMGEFTVTGVSTVLINN